MIDKINGKMVLEDENGLKKTYNVLYVWINGDSRYMAYTDDQFTSGCDICVSKYVMDGDKIKLIPIVSDAEWNYVEKYLKGVL